MDFQDSPEEAAFRAEASAFLTEHAPVKGQGPEIRRRLNPDAFLQAARAWQSKKAEARFAQITWPTALGGRGGTPMQQVIWNQEEARFDVPTGPFTIGLGMCVPTVIAFGSDTHRARYVARALRGDEIWCQLFSEPAAGSDVAGLRTRAVRDGEHWVLNGQKVWTSGAHYSDFGIVLVRTDPGVAKHKGLTMFILDMKAPGVEVRPIHQISGGRDFNEVYFTDVRVPDSDRLGGVGDGWKVALVTLMNERLAVGGSPGPDWREFLELARQSGSLGDQAVREKLADWHVRAQGYHLTRFRTMTALAKGQAPGPEASIGKIITANQLQQITTEALELQDHYGILTDPTLAMHDGGFQQSFFWAPGLRIAGGTDEILKNIIAERVLGLPQELRPDKSVPFEDLPTGV